MSVKGVFGGAEIDYSVLKDFCKKDNLEAIYVLGVAKRLLAIINKKDNSD